MAINFAVFHTRAALHPPSKREAVYFRSLSPNPSALAVLDYRLLLSARHSSDMKSPALFIVCLVGVLRIPSQITGTNTQFSNV